jgi:sulfate transport system ATP-binding protein
VWDHPASPFVYGFLGDVNLFHGRAHEGLSAGEQQRGIVATLVRAIVVGPIARLELLPLDAVSTGSSEIIEAQIAAQQFATLMLKEGETLVLTPRRARVFVA